MFKMVFDLYDENLINKIQDAAKGNGLTYSRKYHYLEVIIPIIEDYHGNLSLNHDEAAEFLKRVEKLTIG